MKLTVNISILVSLLSLSQTVVAITVPLELEKQQWRALEYRNIRANQVSQEKQGLRIQVDSSASPLIYVFDSPQTIQKISVRGKMGDLPNIPEDRVQGEKGVDDFPLRLGLVLKGDKKLNFAQRLIAAEWVKILFDLAPPDTGIDQIMFLTVANSGYVNEPERVHSNEKNLFTEIIVKQVNPNEKFHFTYTLPMPEQVIALWISADGDDTGSKFELVVNAITYD